MLHDLRYAVRLIRRSPGFALVVILSLALGIGANTAIFSLVDAVLIRSLPVKDPGGLVLLQWSARRTEMMGVRATRGSSSLNAGRRTATAFSYAAYEQLRARQDLFSTLVAFASDPRMTLVVDGDASVVDAQYVSGNFFAGLGVRTMAGRPISDEDDHLAAPPVAVISAALWKRRLGGDASAIGKAITLNGKPRTVIGVAPAEFLGVQPGEAPDVWVPLAAAGELGWDPPPRESTFWWLILMGRLAPGVTAAQARAAIDPALADLVNAESKPRTTADLDRLRSIRAEEARAGRGPAAAQDRARLALLPGRQGPDQLRRQFSSALLILMSIVALVLLVACANVASLLLARATARRREIAIRLSIGAGRARLIRQLLTESVVLAGIGGALGAIGAVWGSQALAATIAQGDNRFVLDVTPNLTVLAFTAAMSIATGVLFGLVPAFRTTRMTLTPALREQTWADRSGYRLQGLRLGLGRSLVVVQVALSLLLLVGAGLFIRTLINLQRVDLGINRANVLLFSLAPGTAGYEGPRLIALYDRLLEQIGAQPGVRSASFSRIPVIAHSASRTSLEIEGSEGSALQPHDHIDIWINTVSARFAETMGIPIVAGRDFGPQDTASSPIVVLVNETMARRFFATPNPVGREFNFGGRTNPRWTVVGVVRDAKYASVQEEVPPTMYYLYRQRPRGLGEMVFEVRTAGEALDFVPAARRIVREADVNLPLIDVKTQSAQVDETLFTERMFARLSGLFAGLALTLACVGVYGLLAYAVTRRTTEIGIRVALGAQRGDVVWMILREALALAAIGVAIGLPAALAATRVLKTMLFGLQPHDPATIAFAAVLLVGVASAAGFIPARRAARVEPMQALRCE
ncbi:MAG TPA: ABC transporter permease [Vicinamibacterales bacterium]|jgi:predicted permease|nr:ABC transporter permease [Vicinamibacterales bacterium]